MGGQDMIQEERTESRAESRPRPFAGAAYDIVAIIASAGGVMAIRRVLSMLPAHFPAAIVVVQHLPPHHRSMLADILRRRTELGVKQAEDGDRLKPGVAYIAPPDVHLLVNPDGTASLSSGERVHYLRPSGDVLFESVAASYGPRAIAVVLTGTGRDGSAGLLLIKRAGGKVIAQDEATAEFGGMPGEAIRTHGVDMILPLDEIAPALMLLVMGEGR
jgi:two-component system chemotaxis response regulator CheB